MKLIISTLFLLLFSLSCRCQDNKAYLVYIFHEDWKKNSLKWNTGDYLWILPYDTCCTKINEAQLKPLFITKEQLSFLDDIDFQKQGIGELPILLNDVSDTSCYKLFKNRKLIQKYEYKHLYSNTKRVLNIYVVPIKAICKEDNLGVYKKSVIRIDDTLEIWDGFWENDTIIIEPYLFYDFSSFNFIVSWNGEFEP